jgi:eukaryotic-like serine/threonine-protein kinase
MEARFGPWRLGRRIASGDFADVSEAIRDGADAPLALKRLHAHAARDPALRTLFEREQAIATALPDHPGLVRGVAAGDDGGRPWLAMPLVGGADLRRHADAGAVPTAARAVAIVVEVCGALAALHAAGWIHGDVTPSNLLVDPAGARLCDFGVARRPGEPGPVRGTHAYMAPEQVRGEPWTVATDVFALGVVLWELAAGARLYYRGAPWLTMAAVVDAPAPPLHDPALDAVVQRALAKNPAARPATAAALADALRALTGE